MKNLKILYTVLLVLCINAQMVFGQDTTSRSSRDSIELEKQKTQVEIEEMARDLEALMSQLGEKISKHVNEEISREIKEAMKELQRELEGMEEELEELDKELEEEGEENRGVGTNGKGESLGEVLDGLDIKWNKKKDKLANVKTRWFLLDLGFASYISPDPLPELDGINPMEPDILNSVSWRLHLVNQRINIIRHHLNLVYGAGFSFNFYGFSNPVTLAPSSPNVNFTLAEGNDASYKKNHLRASYLHLPVMLNIETNPYQKSKSFHINAGVYGNVLLGGKTSQKTNNRKTKIKDKYNLENFQYGLIGQIGYGPVTFYGTYGLNELFKPEKDNGYTVNPITFGIKLIPF